MTMFLAPYTAIADIDGNPLDAGFLFFGESGKNPESFPIPIYWDADFTIPAAQPIRTRNGYPIRNGSPCKIYLKQAEHSLVIKNKNLSAILIEMNNKGISSSLLVRPNGDTVETSLTNIDAELNNKQQQIDEKPSQQYVDEELDLKAPKETTYTKLEVDSALSLKAPQSNTYTKAEVDTTFAAYVGGRKAFTTLALAQAAQSSLPANTAIEITNDGANNGTYQWNGTTLTKSAYDPLTQAKGYADMYARSQAYDNTRHLDTYETEGRITVRFNVDAKAENGFPFEAVNSLCFIEIYRNGTDSTLFQKLTTHDNTVLFRRRVSGVWSAWQKQRELQKLASSTNIKTLALSLNDCAAYAAVGGAASLLNGFPHDGVSGVAEIFAWKDSLEKIIVFTSVNRQKWITTHRISLVASGEWSEWTRIDKSDEGIFGILDRAKTNYYDFSNINSSDAAKLNTRIRQFYCETNQNAIVAGAVDTGCVLDIIGGGIALRAKSYDYAAVMYPPQPLLSALNQTLMMSFYHDDSSYASGLYTQTSGGQAGRLQIGTNLLFNGSGWAVTPDSFGVFLNGVSDGSGVGGAIKSGKLKRGWNTFLLILSGQAKGSKLVLNGKVIDTFTATAIYPNAPKLLPDLINLSSKIKLGRIISYREVIADSLISTFHEFLLQGYNQPLEIYDFAEYKPTYQADLGAITLTSSLSAAAMILSQDGSFIESDVIYKFNEATQRAMYSITKVMTLICVVDMKEPLNTLLTKTDFDTMGGSGANLNTGDQLYLRDALYNLMLPSSNVTARVIARTLGHKLLIKDGVTGGTDTQAVARWVTYMNTKATEIGMSSATYSTPDGNGPDTAYPIDLLKKANYAMQKELIRKVWRTQQYTFKIYGNNPRLITVENSNTLLKNETTIGGKSGSSTLTNLLAVHELPDKQFLATAVLHAVTTEDRNADTMSMINVALSRYS